MNRAWGTDGQIHIMVRGQSWCGAETYTEGDSPAAFPPDAEALGLVCRQCREMYAALGQKYRDQDAASEAVGRIWAELTRPFKQLLDSALRLVVE